VKASPKNTYPIAVTIAPSAIAIINAINCDIIYFLIIVICL
jgi:hypothetical protein